MHKPPLTPLQSVNIIYYTTSIHCLHGSLARDHLKTLYRDKGGKLSECQKKVFVCNCSCMMLSVGILCSQKPMLLPQVQTYICVLTMYSDWAVFLCLVPSQSTLTPKRTTQCLYGVCVQCCCSCDNFP